MNTRLENSNKPTLSQRITSYLNEIRVDALGIEKKVIQNIHSYFSESGRKYDRPHHELLISIRCDNGKLKVRLFHKSKFLTCLKEANLVDFFSAGMGSIPGFTEKISKKVLQYLHDLAKENQVPLDQLDIVIVNCSKLVVVETFNGKQFLKQIPLKELIKHFSK